MPGKRIPESAVHSNQSLTTLTRNLYGFDDWFPPNDESFNIKQAPTGLKDSALRNNQHGQDRLQDKHQLGNRSWASSFHKKSLNNHKHQIKQTNKQLQDSLSQGTDSSAGKTEVYSSVKNESSQVKKHQSTKPTQSTSHRKAKLDISRASHQTSKLDNLQNVKENSLKIQRLSKSRNNRERKVQGHTNGRVSGAVGPLTVKKKGDEGNAPNLPDSQDSEKYGSQNQRKSGPREKMYDTDVINAGDTESKPTSRMMSALIPSRGLQGRAGEPSTRIGNLPEMYSDSVRRPPVVDRLVRHQNSPSRYQIIIHVAIFL